MGYIVNDKGTLIKIDGEITDSLTFPSNTVRIGKNLFANKNVKEVVMEETLKYVGEKSFYNCIDLESVRMDGVVQLDNYCFANCKTLKSIILPSSLSLIKENAFSGCTSIEEIILPHSIKEIQKGTFDSCINLNKVILPESLSVIGERAFYGCANLRNIDMPNSIREIGENAFTNCTSLKEITLSENLEVLRKYAFERCSSLKKIVIKENVSVVEAGCFNNCYNLKEIRIRNYSNITQPGIAMLSYYDYYLDRETGELILTTEAKDDEKYRKLEYKEISEELSINNRYSAVIASVMFEKDEFQAKEIKPILFLIREISKENISINNYKYISSSLYNSKEFINLLKHIGYYSNKETLNNENKILIESKIYGLFKFAYLIGVFSDDHNNRQKSSEFLKTLFDKGILSDNNIYELFKDLNFTSYNEEIAKFIMYKDNCEQMLKKEKDFLSHTLNEFEEVKEYCRSTKGDQDYLMVTLDVAVKFYKKTGFDRVNSSNRDVAETIGKFTFDQSVFDDAAKIREEYLKRRAEGIVNDHILGEELKGSSNTFIEIEKVKNEIVGDISNVMCSLNETANNKFTFEYLSKYDPDNFVLGKYCSCCAHLEALGYSIVKASILHPDCQNLVIRNEKGKIIAKSTLYVNRSQGYGLFNNVEINTKIKDEKDIEMIYNCYISAVKQFANRYNELYPDNPLMQINVGMNSNDLLAMLEKNHKEEQVLLEGLDFTPFGKINQLHSGDWKYNQRVLWKNEEIRGKESNGR